MVSVVYNQPQPHRSISHRELAEIQIEFHAKYVPWSELPNLRVCYSLPATSLMQNLSLKKVEEGAIDDEPIVDRPSCYGEQKRLVLK